MCIRLVLYRSFVEINETHNINQQGKSLNHQCKFINHLNRLYFFAQIIKSYNNGENGYGLTTDVQYWGELIHKALQLVRDPFHVVETRFLYITNYYNGDLDWTVL